MSITIDLSAEAEKKLRQQAADSGQSVNCYLRAVIEQQVLGMNGPIADPSLAPPANPQPWPPFQRTPIDPEILEWARKTINEEEIIAGIREIEETGGLQLEDFIKEVEEIVMRRE